MTRVEPAGLADLDGWRQLAREVDPLFGPMADSPDFQEALKRAIACHEAFCIRSGTRGEAPVLEGAVVVSKASNEIVWLAVADGQRGQGLGKALLAAALFQLDGTQPITVQTFAPSVPAGLAARNLYLGCGFTDHSDAGLNPAGVPTVIMRLGAS